VRPLSLRILTCASAFVISALGFAFCQESAAAKKLFEQAAYT
jgi:hypothetical protein